MDSADTTLADRLRALAGGGADALKAALDRRHEDASGDFGASWWRLVRDAYEGTGGFRSATRAACRGDLYGAGSYERGAPTQGYRDTYLAQFPREGQTEFQRRVDSSTYLNLVAPVVDTYRGHLTRRAPKREATSDAVTSWWQDVDGSGRAVDAWLRAGILRTQLIGWSLALFDRPAGDYALGTVATRATWLEPEEVRDWSLAPDGTLDWLRLGSERCEVDPVTGAEVERYEYTLWTRSEWARASLVERDGVYTVEAIDGGAHDLGRVPVALLRWRPALNPRCLFGVSQVSDIVPLALGLFNTESQLTHHLANAVFAILAIQSDAPDPFADLKLGTNNGIAYPTTSAAPTFVAPPESVSMQLTLRAEQLIDAIYQAARVERPKASAQGGDVASGIARAYDFAQTESLLQEFVRELTAFERDCTSLVAAWDGTAAEVKVEYPTRFDVRGLQDELTGQLAALTDQVRPQMVPTALRHARVSVALALNPEASPEEEAAIRAEAEQLFERETAALDTADHADAIAALPPVTDGALVAHPPESPADAATAAPAP